jgi:hypothetical protein
MCCLQALQLSDLFASQSSRNERKLPLVDQHNPENPPVVGQDGEPTMVSFSFSVCAASPSIARATQAAPTSRSGENGKVTTAGHRHVAERHRYMGRGGH